ncbi:PadR family transcriptional regulator [Rathayibacter sp. VKM Ac-2804]|uniref:PadR family transcriptional regulator n=1 Tax=Rathayibacter sp. VKM Ac-2804 TaxID=2609257 RepID=UPI00132ECBB6|nr:helix-turn-helix transcriptional regulator [Rathayibacter sp. VKM Ac-2804]QHF24141.1 PadR family transcriptional regulator [Rathayibacter sp. VKM Ac-2804]
MSVRDGLLALLTLGPAYGLQLHAELLDRAAHRRRVNVGQIYSTLDRLRERGLVAGAGSTEDGLPLHALTDEGRAEALAWLSGDGASAEEDWDDVLDRILLASSLSDADLDAVLDAYGSTLPDEQEVLDDHPQRRLAARAVLVRDDALRRLLEAAREELAGTGDGAAVRGYALERPRRGRRAAARDDAAAEEPPGDRIGRHETGAGAVA